MRTPRGAPGMADETSMPHKTQDEPFMRTCLDLAAAAAARGEVPVGAVIALRGQVVGRAGNQTVARKNPLAHAEMVALAEAFAAVGEGRLPEAVAYCSLEPCFMCTGALLHARVSRIVFAARDPKFGACRSLARLPEDPRLNHRCPVDEGLFADESAGLLRAFFERLR
jgi:tRNA(adenine34) deaminase